MNRLRVLLALALGVTALLALAGPAAAKDSNHDKIPDRWEKRHKLSLKVDQSRRDQDRDGLRNRAEFRTSNDPRDADSDGDGVSDGDEGAGTIVSFDAETGRLVIDLFADDEIAGFVTDQTRIKCERSGDDGATVSRSEGEDEPGDDHGDHAEEPGDDHSDDESGDSSGPSENSGPGSEDSGHHGEDGDCEDSNCGTDALQVGAVVEEAELDVRNGKATFEEVELAH